MSRSSMIAVQIGVVIVVGLLSLVGVFFVGKWSASWWPEVPKTEAKREVWMCPMHPQIKAYEPGKMCSICGMPLERPQDGDAGPRKLTMSPEAAQLARIQTAPVQRKFLARPTRLTGKVAFDETLMRTIAARVSGRLDRLYVDYTGVTVKENDHLVWLYSPELLTAQQELIEAKKRMDAATPEVSQFLRDSSRRGYTSAREKLMLWGLTEDQVDAIEARGTAGDHMEIRSPLAGVVVEKSLNEGAYVKVGTPIYRIADLSRLWILLDAYEQDLPWLRFGQAVAVQTEALPGEVFEGFVAFIQPTVDERTRTVRVRVNISNRDGKLKPGMFVRALVKARIGAGAKVLEPRLAGKWISPMHPEVVKDGPGKCDVCGMDLVPAESLGYLGSQDLAKPVVVPSSAVLVTGTRAVVYVEVPGEQPTYEGREVVLGPRAGDEYIVRDGLREHERVVVHGAFRVDSAMQIGGKPSMMSMRGEAQTFLGPDTAVFRLALEPVYDAYLQLQSALAGDDPAASRAAATLLLEKLAAVHGSGLPRPARVLWEEEHPILARTGAAIAEAESLATMRKHFEPLSRTVLTLERAFRHAADEVRYEAYCPMVADNAGAAWVQRGREIRNPYFGAKMFTCGEVRSELPGLPQRVRAAAQDPGRVEAVYAAYFALHAALAGDDAAAAERALAALAAAYAAAPVPDGAVREAAWQQLGRHLAGASPAGLDDLRRRFATVSAAVLAVHAAFGHRGDAPYYRMHCPMAFDGKGARWMQRNEKLSNPYFGAKMPDCGSTEQVLPGGLK